MELKLRGYSHETGTNSDRYQLVSVHTSCTFLFMRLHGTGLKMNSDRSQKSPAVAYPTRDTFRPYR